MKQKTLALIKPDAVAARHSGDIIRLIELNGFDIVRLEKLQLTRETAEAFYEIHKEKPFFGELVANISASPLIAMVLEKENAIQAWRDLMGATDPLKAAPDSIRRKFGVSIGHNAVHGSDAEKTAAEELALFFPE